MKGGGTMSQSECSHKWKIIKEFKDEGKNLLGKKFIDTIYHSQCEKCGAIKSERAQGFEEK